MKQTVVAKDKELRQKQREIDQLHGKLTTGSALAEPEMAQKFQEPQARFGSVRAWINVRDKELPYEYRKPGPDQVFSV